MFTGIVEAVGTVKAVLRSDWGSKFLVDISNLSRQVRIGDSVAINGCCLTATGVSGSKAHFDAVRETLERTNLALLTEGDRVNLEAAIGAGEPMGGHFVQGHIDCTGVVESLVDEGEARRVRLSYPVEFAPYVAQKGSVAADGVSLTVAACGDNFLEVVLVPHTIKVTTLGAWEVGYRPNIEFDVLAKYVERMLGLYTDKKQP
ncbi:MAG: riboflavin synthase [Acidimicrobiia bacterium]